ncbi:MAG: 4-hydroxythreonine-4-phosphate dehydrogenase PdxA [Desulfobulbaceae bacterium]|nr:4-hydroxythreonine-4-phosphate dehydrogenase PdxA [Desulfobulbaceae bacterium]
MTIIGITMGCPAGIGPEIILRSFAGNEIPSEIRPVVLGDIRVLEKCGADLHLPAPCEPWTPGSPLPANGIPVVQLSALQLEDITWGLPNKRTGIAMAHYIESGVELTQQGFIDGIATCPISKSSLNDAGYLFPGHTEMLASLTKAPSYAMMMAGSKLRVTLVTIHCPLRAVASSLSKDSVYGMIRETHRALKIDFAIDEPKIAVAGLNPHGGENRLFGNEEEQIIGPAIEHAQTKNMNISGPFPPDTVFFKAAAGEFDAVVCMYHDQGLIPFKLLHFEDGVNITLGLPIVRTSVDHGTAYDIAGQGRASHKSLDEAIRLAGIISRNRATYRR